MKILTNVTIAGDFALSSSKKDNFIIGSELERDNALADELIVWANAKFQNDVTLGSSSLDIISVKGQLTSSANIYLSQSNIYLTGSSTIYHDGVDIVGNIGVLPYNSTIDTYFLLSGTGSNGGTDFTDTGLVDTTVSRVGTTQTSTAESKWGSGSIYFSSSAGDGCYLTVPSTTGLAPRLNDFTYECWVYLLQYHYPDSAQPYSVMFSTRNVSTHVGGIAPVFDASGHALLVINGFIAFTSTQTASLNEWTHYAIVRENGVFSQYLNGERTNTYSNTLDFANDTMFIGAPDDFTGADTSNKLCGYMSDLRYSGYARYSGATITLPNAPFPAADVNPVSGQAYVSQGNIYVCTTTDPTATWKRALLVNL